MGGVWQYSAQLLNFSVYMHLMMCISFAWIYFFKSLTVMLEQVQFLNGRITVYNLDQRDNIVAAVMIT